MDHLMGLSEYMVKKIKENSDKFYLILEPEMVNVSFWYIPKRLRGVQHNKNREQELGKVLYIYTYIHVHMCNSSDIQVLSYEHLPSPDVLQPAQHTCNSGCWNILNIYFVLLDLSSAEGPYDASRYTDGRLPTGRCPAQLLPEHYLVSCRHGEGRRLFIIRIRSFGM